MLDSERWRERLAALPVEPAQIVAGVVVVIALVIGGIAALNRHHGGPPPDSALPRATAAATGATSTTPAPADGDVEIVVDVAGAVVRPGVYKLAGGARATDAVAAAGGVAPNANLELVNLAAKLTDGQRIYVPRLGEPAPAVADSTQPTGPVDLNSATLAELDTLPGVGPAMAQAILDWRAAHGRFRTVDDLSRVRGIGPNRLAQLRPKVRV